MILPEQNLPPLRIFVADPHPETLEAFRDYLEALGHTVFTAPTLPDACLELPKAKCDVFLCDAELTDGTGWTLLQLMRRAQLSYPRCCISMSNWDDRANLFLSRRAGFQHHLRKPIDFAELDLLLRAAGFQPGSGAGFASAAG